MRVWLRFRMLKKFFSSLPVLSLKASSDVWFPGVHHFPRFPETPFLRKAIDVFVFLIGPALLFDGQKAFCQEIIKAPGCSWLFDSHCQKLFVRHCQTLQVCPGMGFLTLPVYHPLSVALPQNVNQQLRGDSPKGQEGLIREQIPLNPCSGWKPSSLRLTFL